MTDVNDERASPGFHELGMGAPILEALRAVGYESPSPIQAQTIPLLLSGKDLLGQAQTGTGKTAAFALPILARTDLKQAAPQALVLVPTRELAIQVAEAFQRYAAHLRGFHVLPIYGGQSYVPQLKGLKRGAHVIVGTPGRVMDHIKRGALSLETVRFIVLDEGDEMLQMGFVDDIEWILQQAPPQRQIALFSATMPPAIRRIAREHLREPAQVTIQNHAGTTPKIRQRYWLVSGLHKLDALTRVLEVERFEAMLVFVRTKLETTELAERLEARGFNAAALNGDIPQPQRERTIANLKAGRVDIVVATDVAARVSMSSASLTWSTTTSRTTRRPTFIGSGVPAAPDAPARPFSSSLRVSETCCASSSGSRNRPSSRCGCRASRMSMSNAFSNSRTASPKRCKAAPALSFTL